MRECDPYCGSLFHWRAIRRPPSWPVHPVHWPNVMLVNIGRAISLSESLHNGVWVSILAPVVVRRRRIVLKLVYRERLVCAVMWAVDSRAATPNSSSVKGDLRAKMGKLPAQHAARRAVPRARCSPYHALVQTEVWTLVKAPFSQPRSELALLLLQRCTTTPTPTPVFV